MKKNITITLIIFLLSVCVLDAQSWQWGKNGGGTAGTSLNPEDNSIRDMKHDKAGNLYVLGALSRFTARFMRDSFIINGNDDLVLYKIDCDGNAVWHKQIGDISTLDYGGIYDPSISIDQSDNVYVTGYAAPSSTHGFKVDADTLFTPAIGQYFRSYIIKFDKNGNYLLFKTNETNRSTNSVIYLRSFFGEDNYLYLLGIVGGNLFGIADTINPKFYLMKYDTSAILQSIHPISDSGAIFRWSITGYKRDLYLSGYTTPVGGPDSKFTILGGHQVVPSKTFVCKFDTSGIFKWITINDDEVTGITDIKYNKNASKIYATGSGGGQYVAGDTGTRFGTVRLENYIDNVSSPIILEFDSSGHCAKGNIVGMKYPGPGFSIDVSSVNNILIGGRAVGHTSIGSDTFNTNGQDGFYAELNSDLEFIGGSTLNGSGFYDQITKVDYDERGNIYLGGYMGGDMYIPADTLHKIGGGISDLFIAKYGVPQCICPYAMANFSDAFTSSLNYTYTSAASNADSIWWDFGDGNTQSGGTTANHTYAASGNYTVCQHVSNDCSIDEFCKNVAVVTGINDVKESYSVFIYPNPTSTSIHIHVQGGDIIEDSKYVLFDVTGKKILSGKITGNDTSILIPDIANGVYLLQISNEGGMILLSKRIEVAK